MQIAALTTFNKTSIALSFGIISAIASAQNLQLNAVGLKLDLDWLHR